MARRLTHEETLGWITAHRAWRLAYKTRPIWARPLAADEAGHEFQTADHTVERAQPGHWLCVGVAGEPWFQSQERIEEKYALDHTETRRFGFDAKARAYRFFQPREGSRNWAAQVTGTDIEGFYIKPNYPTESPLYSPAGGYVVTDYVDDPYAGAPNDVWLVQQALFESTYEMKE